MKDLLTSIPPHLATVVICNWLSLATIVQLDSAYCNRKLRPDLLNFLRSIEFIHSHYTGLEDPSMLMWLVLRQAHVQSVVVDFRRDVLIADDYLKFGGNCVQRMELRNSLARDLMVVSMHCKNLRFLVHKNSHFNDSFLLSLRNNSMLLELRLDQIQYHPPWEPKCYLSLPQLRVFSMRNSRCTEKLLAKLVGSSTHLRVFDAYHTAGVTSKVLLWIAQRCSLLATLGLGHIHIEDETVSLLCTHCPKILHLDLSYNQLLTDIGMQQVSEQLRSLESINLEGCARLTEQTFVHLLQCKNSLQRLHIDAPYRSDSSILACSLKQFVNCTVFSSTHDLYYYITPPSCLLSSLNGVITLSLCEQNVTDGTLSTIARYCRSLRHLNLNHSKYFRAEFTRGGLAVVADCCVHLTLLLLPKTMSISYYPMEDRDLFVSLRPGLKMVSTVENTPFEFDVLKLGIPLP